MTYFNYVLLIASFGIVGCQTPPQPLAADFDFGPYPTDIASKVEASFESILKDPESARYRYEDGFIQVVCNEWLGSREVTFAGWAQVVGVNAKNSFGGYSGETRYAVLFEDDEIQAIYDNPEFTSAGCVKR